MSFAPTGDPEVDGFKQEVVERAGAKGLSYYDVLGVPPDATPAQIQGAFFKLAKRWHPDRLGAPFNDVRVPATKVFSRMSEAHQVLTDPARRKEYDEMLLAGGGAADEQEKVAAVLRAASSFQRAEVALKRNRFGEAEREVRAALDDDPEHEEYQGTLAWIEANKPGVTSFEEHIKILTRAINKDQNNPRLRWYRGQLHKKAGNEQRAVHDFKQILEVNPHHVEAAREIRLFDMRRISNRPTSGLGKWFRR
jgi:curved DNA-binding protein CbpA